MKSIFESIKKLFASSPRVQLLPPASCNTHLFIFTDTNVIHVTPTTLEIFSRSIETGLSSESTQLPITLQLSSPSYSSMVPTYNPVFSKGFFNGKWIHNTNQIIVITVDLCAYIIDFKRGRILTKIANVHYADKFLYKNTLLAFGTNIMRSISLKTFKSISVTKTAFSSMVNTFDCDNRNAIIAVGSYLDIHIFDYQLHLQIACLRAHPMRVVAVKFLAPAILASISEADRLVISRIPLKTSHKSPIESEQAFQTIFNCRFSDISLRSIHFKDNTITLVDNSLIKQLTFNRDFRSLQILLPDSNNSQSRRVSQASVNPEEIDQPSLIQEEQLEQQQQEQQQQTSRLRITSKQDTRIASYFHPKLAKKIDVGRILIKDVDFDNDTNTAIVSFTDSCVFFAANLSKSPAPQRS